MDALLKLGLVVTGLSAGDEGRTLRELGLEGMSGQEMIEYVS
jgi:hypothetical protein